MPSVRTAGGDETVAPHQIGVREFSDYALVIDARSPREYVEDHLPLAVNLPVVNDDQYAEVGTRHKSDKHGPTWSASSIPFGTSPTRSSR